LYGIRPWEIDRLTVDEFERLAQPIEER